MMLRQQHFITHITNAASSEGLRVASWSSPWPIWEVCFHLWIIWPLSLITGAINSFPVRAQVNISCSLGLFQTSLPCMQWICAWCSMNMPLMASHCSWHSGWWLVIRHVLHQNRDANWEYWILWVSFQRKRCWGWVGWQEGCGQRVLMRCVYIYNLLLGDVFLKKSSWFSTWYLTECCQIVLPPQGVKKSINKVFVVVRMSIPKLGLCEGLTPHKRPKTGEGGRGEGWRRICAALLTSGEDKRGNGSVEFSIKSRKTQLAPNITSDGFLDQLLPWRPTEEQIAFLAGHLDTPALIDMDPSMPSQARRQFNMSNTVISI